MGMLSFAAFCFTAFFWSVPKPMRGLQMPWRSLPFLACAAFAD